VAFVISADTWRALPGGLVGVGQVRSTSGSRSSSAQWRLPALAGPEPLPEQLDSRQGLRHGQYVPAWSARHRGVQAAPAVSAFIFEPTPANMARWRRWWRFANVEQLLTFVLVTVVTICLTSMLAHSTLFGTPGLPRPSRFCRSRGVDSRRSSAPGSACSSGDRVVLALRLGDGIADYTSRLAATS